MTRLAPQLLILTGALAALAGCASAQGARTDVTKLDYQGIETRLLDNDLVDFQVGLGGPNASADRAEAYAACAAAQYTMIRGYGFARHIRTHVTNEAGVWRADAVYLISPALPQGLLTIDAEVTLADCRERGIPTV
ncbi:MAG: hypothetical protein IE922_04735 [Sphingomonadales bacterium]|nr:hypothetical protein [Sphingomonadales bacterium]